MTDIVERLRSFGSLSWIAHARNKYEVSLRDANMIVISGREAADAIERLRLSLSEARATGRREGLSEAAGIAQHVDLFDGDKLKNSDPRETCAAAIRAAMEKA